MKKSYIKQNQVYFTHAMGVQKFSGTKISKDAGHTQKKICDPSPQSAGAITLKKVWEELKW